MFKVNLWELATHSWYAGIYLYYSGDCIMKDIFRLNQSEGKLHHTSEAHCNHVHLE